MWHVVLTSILMLCYRIPDVVRAVEYLVHAYGQVCSMCNVLCL